MSYPKQIDDHEHSKFDVNSNNDSMVRIFEDVGTSIDPLAKYVEATYSNLDLTVTYSYYESSLKATLYNTITLNYTSAQDTTFTSAEWS